MLDNLNGVTAVFHLLQQSQSTWIMCPQPDQNLNIKKSFCLEVEVLLQRVNFKYVVICRSIRSRYKIKNAWDAKKTKTKKLHKK